MTTSQRGDAPRGGAPRRPEPGPSVVLLPNSLRGYATSAEVAAALAVGVRRARPAAGLVVRSIADGGDGTLDALSDALGGVRHPLDATDALGRTRRTSWLALDGSTAAVETASLCGLGALRPDELDPLRASSAGVGRAIAAAVSAGATNILVGLGGTAVVDGGAGALAALGARFLDARGGPVTPVPGHLDAVARVDLSPARTLLAGVSLRLLSDVRTPLSGNLASFGAQKGLTAHDRPTAVRALGHLAELLESAGPLDAPGGPAGPGARARFHEPWYGAGGGIGFGLASVARTTAGSGSEGLLAIVDPEGAVDSAALAITAEGVVDAATWHGKLPGAVADRRRGRERPTAVVAVRFEAPLPDRFVSAHLISEDTPPPRAVTGPALWEGLADAAERACRTWLREGRLERV
ncbi:glycerate kinase [Streptomyces sp. NPDC005533]|uniref:glycerate kinase n=1 Tax=Streptomyces sp. NPDC005533 TaxID=3364723 RepID=UPI0036A8E2CB